MRIPSYSTIFNLGHRALSELFADEVLIEEKIDGSQFSMGILNGELVCRSKGSDINIEYPEKMFSKAIEVAKTLPLREGYIYRGEYLSKPKHNVLCYDRVPKNHIIIFDIDVKNENYLTFEEKRFEAQRIGLECVPVIFKGKIENPETLLNLLETKSILGGQKIEGMVIKNYHKFYTDKKTLMGKYVSEAFKEVHNKEWKENNKSGKDILQLIIESYRTPARWQKAMQHLKEAGQLTNTPKDIGDLLKETQIDIEKECLEEIKDKLYKHYRNFFLRGVVAGLPEWYKEQLLKLQFEEE